MSLLLKAAARNILRNARRSFMTGSAVAAGALAMTLFGGFVSYIFAGLETSNVQRVGHLSVFRNGYFLFGSGNPFDTIPRLLELYRAGQLKLDELVTNRYRLDDVNQGYRDMLDGRNIRGLMIHDS